MFPFLLGGSSLQQKYASFENVQYAIKHRDRYLLINTLPLDNQKCLIQGTTPAIQEEQIVNEMVHNIHIPDRKIIVYGKNDTDSSVEQKYRQLCSLGVEQVFIYNGGMFEWLLLQDIYGEEEFMTSSKELDILKYRPSPLSHSILYNP